MNIEKLNKEEVDKIIPLIYEYKKSIHEEILIESQLFELKKAIKK